jgi:CheY-like chemotaxis protein
MTDGRSGLQAASEQPFDLVIVDIFMPGMDGLEAIRNFHQVLPRVPIIAMSGFMFRAASALTPDFLAMASKFGAACSLPKPFKPEELLGAVQLCLPPNAPVA